MQIENLNSNYQNSNINILAIKPKSQIINIKFKTLASLASNLNFINLGSQFIFQSRILNSVLEIRIVISKYQYRNPS